MHIIDIKLRFSWYFLISWCATVIGTLVIICTLPLTYWSKVVLLIGAGYYSWYILQHSVLLRRAQSITRLRYDREHWELLTAKNACFATLCGESTLTAGVLILRFQPENQRRKLTCLIFKDTVGQDNYRRLLAALRTAKIHPA